jgi:hypothetical protein
MGIARGKRVWAMLWSPFERLQVSFLHLAKKDLLLFGYTFEDRQGYI